VKRLLLALLILSTFVLAAPTHAAKGRLLLVQTVEPIHISHYHADNNCIPVWGDGTITDTCLFDNASWNVERDATITEIQVIVLGTVPDSSGQCTFGIWKADAAENFDIELGDEQTRYVNFSATASVGDQYRWNADIDVERGDFIGFAVGEYDANPVQCDTESSTNAIIQMRIWGEYTD
jgi:hypothetical protein